jgi:hypothetical protein
MAEGPAAKRARTLRGLHAESWSSRSGLARILRGLHAAGHIANPAGLGLRDADVSADPSGSRLRQSIGEAVRELGDTATPYGPLLQRCRLTDDVSVDFLCPQALALGPEMLPAWPEALYERGLPPGASPSVRFQVARDGLSERGGASWTLLGESPSPDRSPLPPGEPVSIVNPVGFASSAAGEPQVCYLHGTSASFRELMREATSVSANGILNCVVYFDEVRPGNVLRPDRARSCWCVYIGFTQWRASVRSSSRAWLPVLYVRSSILAQAGGPSSPQAASLPLSSAPPRPVDGLPIQQNLQHPRGARRQGSGGRRGVNSRVWTQVHIAAFPLARDVADDRGQRA